MPVERVLLRYEEELYFPVHPDIAVVEAEENLWLLEHVHDFVEIVLVAEGNGLHYLNGEPLQVRSGDLFALPVGTRHVFRPSGDPSRDAKRNRLKVFNCLIRRSAMRRLAEFLADREAANFARWLVGDGGDFGNAVAESGWLRLRDDGGDLRRTFLRLKEAYSRHSLEPDSLSLWASAMELLSAVYRGSRERTAKAGDPDDSQSPVRRPWPGSPLSLALAYMKRHYAERVTLADAAAAAGIGPRQLSRLFARRMGTSFRSALEEIRTEACCRLLRDTRIPIKDLPPRVGLEQWKTLSRLFRKRMGTTLGEYRRSHSPAPEADSTDSGSSQPGISG
ncbi:hypothetical protein J19TS2_22010 [Cohnella xylanilytica]|uniref:AraC family transcriptional regulator n=1 Tax=Cohnella xylanilytica TaxID=557555 RepID=UPI001B278DA7|nr:AraC family transcriptional regulator [Cohnella xylanilytica]GIO12646.1 hypothetical protein J19TS2_22010 [Cohnella xylanilytica]